MYKSKLVKEIVTPHVEILQSNDLIDEAINCFFSKKIHNIIIQEFDGSYSVLTLSLLLDFIIDDVDKNKTINTMPCKKLLTLNENEKALEAIYLLERETDIIGITDDSGEVYGVLTLTDIVNSIEQKSVEVLENVKVENIFIRDSSNSVKFGERFYSALKKFRISTADCLVILRNRKPLGIITKRDLLRFSKKNINFNGNIEEYMSTPLASVNITASVTSALELMQEKHFRRAVVKDNDGNFLGVITQKILIEHIYTHITKKYSQKTFRMNTVLTESVQKRTAELEKYKDSLEELVQERTKDLQISNNKLIEEVEKRKKAEMLLQDKKIELERLNERLELKVEEEIGLSRQKDLTIFNQSKMAAMGELISMIAHQWRQPLTDISLQATKLIVKQSLKTLDDKYLEKNLDEMSDTIQYMSKTIDDFRDFYIPNKLKESVYLEHLLESSFRILKGILENNNIEIKSKFDNSLSILTHKNELIQVFLNILKNSIDVLIEQKVANPYIEVSCIEQENQIMVVIRDNGGGVEEGILNKIFNPYFTTKNEKNGTGLGLYMASMIVEDHCNGTIDVVNDSSGAVFSLKFPKGESK